jgi:lipoprotein-anchoring transpeptidase ErfK/SrfK
VRAPVRLPLAGGEGPDVLRAQILLDAAGFAPGAVDGRWAENTLFAVRTFRMASGLGRADEIDEATWERLVAATGGRDPIADYVLTAADVRGPYRRLPKSIYAKARLDCLCHESLVEALAERFHTTQSVIRGLNPDTDLARAAVGTTVRVPNVAARPLREPPARLEVNREEGSLRGLDAAGRTLFWMPATVGSDTEPSPVGRLRVVSVERNPRYHFNPRVLGDIPDSQPDATLAPGPNSPVGVLWAQLSKAHVGIHGSPDPELIGYAESHGCVRLTNWDAAWLAGVLRPGMEVVFR